MQYDILVPARLRHNFGYNTTILLVLLLTQLTGRVVTDKTLECVLTPVMCKNQRELENTQIYEYTAHDEGSCLSKANLLHDHCMNGYDIKDEELDRVTIAASYGYQSLFYHPFACEKGWTPFGTDCYVFVQNPLSWVQAESTCRSMASTLASIHFHGENEFVHAIAGYQSIWIGLASEDQQWTDRTATDYSNWTIDCTVEENFHTRECQGHHNESHWYDRQENEVAPFVCKKPSALTSTCLVNVSAAQLGGYAEVAERDYQNDHSSSTESNRITNIHGVGSTLGPIEEQIASVLQDPISRVGTKDELIHGELATNKVPLSSWFWGL